MRQLLSHRLIWLALLLSLGIGALFARSIWTIRSDEWNYARQTNVNLVRTLEKGLRWSLDSYTQSLQGVAREVARPEVWALPPELLARVVFDNSLSAPGMGNVLVLDEHGTVVLDSGSLTPRQGEVADRDYFKAFHSGGHQGLFVGAPITSRISSRDVVPLALPYHHADGRFAGVVVGVIRLGYFNELFGQLELGESSGVNLLRSDGVVMARFPYDGAHVGKSLAGTFNMLRFQQEGSGFFVGRGALDGVERLYAFQKVGDYPLIINVAQSTTTVLASWRRSAWGLGAFALLLMLACLGLAGLFVRELALRQQVSARLAEAEHDMRTVLDNVPSMIAYWDAQLHNRFANRAALEEFGTYPEPVRGRALRELLSAQRFAASKPFYDRALAGQPQRFEREDLDAKGQPRHSIVSYLPDTDAHGAVNGIFVHVIDITDRKRMESELFEEKERMRLTLASIGDAVICTDAHGQVTFLNPVAERLTGWQAFDAAGQSVDTVVHLRSTDNDSPVASPLRLAMEQASAAEAIRGVVVHRTSGQRFQVEEIARPITDRHGHVTGAVAVLRDVTEAVAMAERMAHLAQYDALTDLPNRVLLHDRAQHAIAQARRDGKSLAVMYLDLDGFKAVNDSLGHAAGDQLLVQFAQRLKAAVRASDTVCRQGGMNSWCWRRGWRASSQFMPWRARCWPHAMPLLCWPVARCAWG